MTIHAIPEEKQAKLLRCLGEPTRLQILRLLAQSERCVGELTSTLSKEQSLISHHLRALKECNIVRDRQEAQKIYYRIADERIVRLILDSEALAREAPLCNCKEVNNAGKRNKRSS